MSRFFNLIFSLKKEKKKVVSKSHSHCRANTNDTKLDSSDVEVLGLQKTWRPVRLGRYVARVGRVEKYGR